MTVYGDVVFAVNAAVDFLLLLLGGRLCGYPVRRRRAALGAAVGGLYAVAVLLPVPAFFRSGWCQGLCFLVMAAAAYGVRKKAIRPAALTLLCGAALAGVAVALTEALSLSLVTLQGRVYYPLTARMLILLAGIFYLAAALLAAGTIRHGRGETAPLELSADGRRIRVSALRDTGNTLTDPVTGRPVVVLEWERGRELLGLPSSPPPTDPARWVEEMDRLRPDLRLRLVPYRAVGVDHGMLAAIPCQVKAKHGRAKPVLAAVSPTPVSDGGAYEALIGGTV